MNQLRHYLQTIHILLRMSICVVVLSLYHASVLADCIPTVNNPIDVNGIVVSTASPGLPPGCPGDQSWAGVIGQSFDNFSGPDIIFNSKIFMAGYNATNDTELDEIYVGLHVENDEDITSNDILTLYWNADGNGTWTDDVDFALQYNIGPMVPSTAEICNVDPQLQYYIYSGGSWVPQSSIPSGISSKVSWDMDNINDPEIGVWELEIRIDVASFPGFSAPTSGSGFGVGAKLYINLPGGGGGTTTLKWPSALTMDGNPTHISPNQGAVLATDLVHPTIGDCADIIFEPDAISGVTAHDADGNNNAFTRLTNADFTGQTPHKQNHFTASLKFYNPSDITDNSPVAFPNVGNIKFFIRPWNGNFLGSNPDGYLMEEQQVTFTHLNQVVPTEFYWPETKNDYDDPVTHQPKNHLSLSSHSCLKVKLEGFPVNLHESSDVVNRNLTYISTSTVRDTFVIGAERFKPQHGEENYLYILRAHWQNIPLSLSKEWSYKFTNASNIGLQDLGNGYYSLLLDPGEEKHVAIAIKGGEMPVAPTQYLLSPRAGGTILAVPSGEPPLDLIVQPGNIVTIIAHGLINVDPKNERNRTNGPNGFSDSSWSSSKFLLPSGTYDPSQNIGALIASFDDFKTAFVVGADMTFLMPKGLKKLSLAINDTIGAYNNNTGKGFKLNVLITKPLFLPTRLASPGNPAIGLPARPRAGSNLPELDIDVFHAIRVKGEKDSTRLKPSGYVAWAVYDSHPEDGDGPICCGQTSAKSVSLSSIFSVFGLVLIWRRIKRIGKF